MFVQKPVPPNRKKRQSLIQGIGVNDADYLVYHTDALGKTHKCPYYNTWNNVLYRCFNKAFQLKNPTYADCTLEQSWIYFSNFRSWMELQDWKDKAIDKDLLIQGNKHYGPDTCVFVSAALNNLLTLRPKNRGIYPLGVCKTHINGYVYYKASCSDPEGQTCIGYFKTPEEASDAYQKRKREVVLRYAQKESHIELRRSLEALANSQQTIF